MKNITSARLICLKGFLFIFCGLLAAAVILMLVPQWEIALLLAVCVWSFCRAYFFCFSVLREWVDPEFRFVSVWDSLRHAGRILRSGRPGKEN